MRICRPILARTILCLLVVGAAVASPPSVDYRDIRALGMGGAGVATVRGFSATMYNPASLVHSHLDLDLVSFQGTIGTDITDMIQFFGDHTDIFDNWDEATRAQQDRLLEGMTRFDDNWMGFGLYPQSGIVIDGLAVGAYGAANVDFRADKGVIDPRVYMRGIADYVFTAAYARELPTTIVPHRLYVGAAVKIIRRYQATSIKMSASDLEIDQAYDMLIEESLSGFGVDLGLLYELSANTDLGLKITDVIGTIDSRRPITRVNLGFGYHPSKRLSFAADINDLFFVEGESFFNKFFVGAEYDIVKWLPVRVGVGQGYPSAGFGLHFGVVEIDGALYGIEYTDTPGGDGDYSYALRLKLGL